MGRYVLLFIVLVVALVYGSIMLLNRYQENKEENKELNSIVLSINPEVLLVYNQDEEIEHFEMLNDEANIAFSENSFIGEKLVDVVDEIIDSSFELAYLDEFSEEILLRIDCEDNEQLKQKLETRMQERLERLAVNGQIEFRRFDDDVKAKADEYEITVGKMIIVSKAMELDDTLEEEALIDLSIREIMQLINAKTDGMRLDIVRRYEQENMVELRTKIKEEASQIRQRIAEEYENFSEMTAEEKRNLIAEERANMLSSIRERISEFETNENFRDVQGRIFRNIDGSEGNDNIDSNLINEEINYLRNRIINEIANYDELSSVERRQIITEIQTNVRNYYSREVRENIDVFRNNLTNRIKNEY